MVSFKYFLFGLAGIISGKKNHHKTNRYAYERNLQNAEFDPIQIVAMVVNNSILSANTTTASIRKQILSTAVADPSNFNSTTDDPEVFADNNLGKIWSFIDWFFFPHLS